MAKDKKKVSPSQTREYIEHVKDFGKEAVDRAIATQVMDKSDPKPNASLSATSEAAKGYVADFGAEDVYRATATAKNIKNPLRRVKKQAPKTSTPVTPGKGKVVVGKPTLMNAAPRVDATPPPSPTPTYGGRPAPAGSRVDEFHVSDQRLAQEKAQTDVPRYPAEPDKDRLLAASKKSKKANQRMYGQDTEPLSEVDRRVKGPQFIGPNKEIGPKTSEEASRKPFSSEDLTYALATAESDGDKKETASVRGMLSEATDREATQNSKVSFAKSKLEKGARSPKSAPNVPKPSTQYVWDSKADKMGTRGKRGEVTHLSEDEDNEIRAGLTAAADAREGGQNRKFVKSTTDWQGKTPSRAEVEEGAADRAMRGPRTSAGEVTGRTVTNPGTNRPAGKAYRAAANAQKRFDSDPNASDFEYEHPDVLAKEANLAGTDLNDPKFKSAGHMSEARTRARVIVHGGVKEDAAKNLKGEGLLGVHDLVMGKKRFEEGRINSGKEYTFSHENGGIGATDTFETGNQVNGVNEERPVPLGHTFKRSTNELPKGSGELVTSNAPGSDYTAGEIRPLSGFEGWTRTQRRAADGTTRHVWTENKLPKDIVHAADTVVEHINKYKRISPKMATKDRLANRAEADKQNAIAGSSETYGLDTRNKRNRSMPPTGENVTAAAQNQASGRTRAAWATGDVQDAAEIDKATPTANDSALSRAKHVEIAEAFIDPKANKKAHKDQPAKEKVSRFTQEKREATPAYVPGQYMEAAASATLPTGRKPSRQFAGAIEPGTQRTARVSLDTMDKPVKEGGTGKSTTVGNLSGLPTLSAGDEAGVSVKGGRKNPFSGKVNDEDENFVPAMDTAVIRTAGTPQVSQQFSRHQAIAALSSASAPTKTPRKVVKKNDKLTEAEASLAKTTKDGDEKTLLSDSRRQGARGTGATMGSGTLVSHGTLGTGSVVSHSKDNNVLVKFDKPVSEAYTDRKGKPVAAKHHMTVPRHELENESVKEQVQVPRGQSAKKPLQETAEPREGVMDLGEDKGKELK
jgi:hypothetical protein